MNLTKRIYDGFLSGSQAEIRDGSCTKEEFVHSCDVALGALKLSSWSDVDSAIAFRLVIRYWGYTESNPTAGAPLMLDEGPERLLGMPEKEFFLLITQAALDNMDNITEEYRGNFAKGVPGDE